MADHVQRHVAYGAQHPALMIRIQKVAVKAATSGTERVGRSKDCSTLDEANVSACAEGVGVYCYFRDYDITVPAAIVAPDNVTQLQMPETRYQKRKYGCQAFGLRARPDSDAAILAEQALKRVLYKTKRLSCAFSREAA